MQDKHETPGIIYDNDKYLTWREVASRLPCGDRACKDRRTVFNWVKAGKLPKPTVAGLFREDEVMGYLAQVSG